MPLVINQDLEHGMNFYLTRKAKENYLNICQGAI